MKPKELLETMLGQLGFVAEVQESEEEGVQKLQVSTRESDRLIGRDGEVLDHLQFLVNRLIQAESGDKDAPRVIVDIENWRNLRDDRLIERVNRAADRVRSTGRPTVLEPMNSYDRRLVHNLFTDDPELMSSSPNSSDRLKRITISPRS